MLEETAFTASGVMLSPTAIRVTRAVAVRAPVRNEVAAHGVARRTSAMAAWSKLCPVTFATQSRIETSTDAQIVPGEPLVPDERAEPATPET